MIENEPLTIPTSAEAVTPEMNPPTDSVAVSPDMNPETLIPAEPAEEPDLLPQLGLNNQIEPQKSEDAPK